MGDGPRRRHETIRLLTSGPRHVAYRSRLVPTPLNLTQVDLDLPDPANYRGAASTLTMPNVTGLRNELQPGNQAAVPVLFDAPDGSHVMGLVQVADVGRYQPSRYQVDQGALDCSCGRTHCEHVRQATDATAAVMNARRLRSAVNDWEQRRGYARTTLAGDHAASVAASRARPAPDGPSWSEDPSHFQAAYNEARTKIANGENPIPYMRDNATGGLGARNGGRAFGVEIEFDFPSTMSISERARAREAIGRDLQAAGLTSSSTQQNYHSARRSGYSQWVFEMDGSVAGEIVSPKMYDEPQTWNQLEQVCNIVRRHGGTASTRAGSHVSVAIADYDHTVENHESLVRGVRQYEDVLYRLGQSTERRRHRRGVYTGPQPAPPAGGFPSLAAAASSNSRYYTVNLAHARGQSTDRVEYRLWDATLDPAAIQGQVNLSLGMTDAAFRDRNWGDATPIGTHYARNRNRLAGQRGARLTGDAWTEDTHQARELADRLFSRGANREQVAALFAATRWNRP